MAMTARAAARAHTGAAAHRPATVSATEEIPRWTFTITISSMISTT
jgi:hypothetical protein